MTARVPMRASFARLFRAEAEAWRDGALRALKRAQEIRAEAGWLRPGPARDAELAEADRLEKAAQGAYGSYERWSS